MKNSIIYLGILLVAFTNNSSASNAFRMTSADVNVNQQSITLSSKILSCEQNKFTLVEDTTVLNPETVIAANFTRTIEEIIAENNQIIENKVTNDATLLYTEKTIEETIAENNQIIESTVDKVISFVYLDKSIEEIIAENNQIIESKPMVEVEPLYLPKTIGEVIAEDNKIIESKVSNDTQPLDFEKINNKSFPVKSITSKVLIGMN
jgi:hypothetical protein